ncbi:hypothetical protein BGW37DRAFT_466979 [Umbelopsis sp. PMI_123]|nr:hypothetical protein BGW37DRAFT_466979 [Umbelopsis sp. PMI_123]
MDYLDRLSNTGTKSRSAQKYIEAVQALVECEGHSLSQLQTESDFLNLFPFVNMIPWVGRPFVPTAIGFLGRYLQIVQAIIVVAMGVLLANILACNMTHTNGLPNGKYTQHVGIPTIMSYEGVMLHPVIRKQFLVTLKTRCSSKMEQSGFRDALETTGGELQAEWERQGAIRFKQAPPNESVRIRRAEAATDVMVIAEMAARHPSSEERRRQFHRLWKKTLPMRQVPAGKYYSTSLMARAQNVLRQDEGRHPLEQILRQYAPPTAQNDDWTWDEEQVTAALTSHGRMMAEPLKRANPEYFSSANQRLRAMARHGTDPNFPISLHGQRVSVKTHGRMTVHWRDTVLDRDEIFRLNCRQACHASDPPRTVQVTAEGIAILDEVGRLIRINGGQRTYDCFLLKGDFAKRKNGDTLGKAWVKSLELEGVLVPVEEPVAGGSGPTTIRNRLIYDLPVGVNDEVTPFKRFLDDTWPEEGEMFFGQADRERELPAESQGCNRKIACYS